jgi:two-component system, OmpR family, alkaline phosphatase synthesis response regulator PhoP
MKQPCVLIVEDDPTILVLTRDLLLKEEYRVKVAANGRDGWKSLQEELCDLIVLDLGLPDMDGLDFCARVKNDTTLRGIPVFMLTARGSADAVVRGLETGAEDYLPKPFNEREFIARIRAILRRQTSIAAKDDYLISGSIKLSSSSHEVWCSDQPISLTLREFDILRVFLSNMGKAFTREDVVRMAWGPSAVIVSKVVDVHLGHLRTKLGPEGKRLETVPQVGYKLVPPKD